ncbi:MAG: hypothetical protein MUF54_26120, partial [Polyangiaceae bacterium]|nr:hypothetical protein [Polyangiaceae bacterium]
MVGYPARTSLPLGAAGVVLAAFALQCGSFATDFATTAGVGGGGMHAGVNGGDAGGCAYGALMCVGTTAYACDAMGNLVDGVDCLGSASGDTTCVDRLGCVACIPGTTACANDVGTYCTADGKSTVSFVCDTAQGMQCTPAGCTGACTPDKLGETHVGCEFWPTVTANSAWSDWFSFGVLVANTTQLPATLTIDFGEIADTRTVSPGGVMTVELP